MTARCCRHNSNGDVAGCVFCRVGDQLADNKAKRDAQYCRYLEIRALNDNGAISRIRKQQGCEIFAQVPEILAELHAVLMIEEMQSAVHTTHCTDAVCSDC